MSNRPTGRPVTPSSRNVTATVKWFNVNKGFGFVTPSDGSPDAFLHISALQRLGLSVIGDGAVLKCDLAAGQRGLQVAMIHEIESQPEPEESFAANGTVDGTVKFFNVEKGFGFVAPDDGGKDVYVGSRVLERARLTRLEPQQRVRVTMRVGQKGPMAESVELI